MRGCEARDGFAECSPRLRESDRRPREQAPEWYGKPPDMIQRQRVEPPVARPERDVGVRAERTVVVVAERMERRLRAPVLPEVKMMVAGRSCGMSIDLEP